MLPPSRPSGTHLTKLLWELKEIDNRCLALIHDPNTDALSITKARREVRAKLGQIIDVERAEGCIPNIKYRIWMKKVKALTK